MSESSTALSVITTALSLPGVKVDRNTFLLEKFASKLRKEEIPLLLEHGPIKSGLFSQSDIHKIATAICSKRKLQSSFLSFMAGLPGPVGAAAAAPADISQFLGFNLKLIQEVVYLYDAEDFWKGGELNNDKVQSELILYLATMFGVSGAANAALYVTKELGKQLAKDIVKKPLTKTTVWYPLLKTLLKYIGVNLTKKALSQIIAKVVPIIGGFVSGALNYYSMQKMSKRLIETLDRGVEYTESEKREDLEAIKKKMPEVYDVIFEEINK